MKDRVEGFLKVARQRIIEDTHNDNIGRFNDLCGSLTSLIKDEELKDYLFTEYEKIVDEVRLQEWDERFLKVIANEHKPDYSAPYAIDPNSSYSSYSSSQGLSLSQYQKQQRIEHLAQQQQQIAYEKLKNQASKQLGTQNSLISKTWQNI